MTSTPSRPGAIVISIISLLLLLDIVVVAVVVVAVRAMTVRGDIMPGDSYTSHTLLCDVTHYVYIKYGVRPRYLHNVLPARWRCRYYDYRCCYYRRRRAYYYGPDYIPGVTV